MSTAPMVEPTPRRRARARLDAPFPVPIASLTGAPASAANWCCYSGELVGREVRVSHPGHIDALHRMGFFGHASLSRFQPEYNHGYWGVRTGGEAVLRVTSRRKYLRHLAWSRQDAATSPGQPVDTLSLEERPLAKRKTKLCSEAGTVPTGPPRGAVNAEVEPEQCTAAGHVASDHVNTDEWVCVDEKAASHFWSDQVHTEGKTHQTAGQDNQSRDTVCQPSPADCDSLLLSRDTEPKEQRSERRPRRRRKMLESECDKSVSVTAVSDIRDRYENATSDSVLSVPLDTDPMVPRSGRSQGHERKTSDVELSRDAEPKVQKSERRPRPKRNVSDSECNASEQTVSDITGICDVSGNRSSEPVDQQMDAIPLRTGLLAAERKSEGSCSFRASKVPTSCSSIAETSVTPDAEKGQTTAVPVADSDSDCRGRGLDPLCEHYDSDADLCVQPDTEDSEAEEADETSWRTVRRRDPFPLHEYLILGLEEAFFLAYGMGCLVVHGEGAQALTLTPLWNACIAAQSNFVPRYVAYHALRARGWVPKEAVKFGCDWLVYRHGPAFYHSSYCVTVREVHQDTLTEAENALLTSWTSLMGCARSVEGVAKQLLIYYVIRPRDLTAEQALSPACLPKFKIKVVQVQRWVPQREREARKHPALHE